MSGFRLDGGALIGEFASGFHVKDGVFADEASAIPNREGLFGGLDEEAELQGHDEQFLAGLEVFKLLHAIEVDDQIQRGLVLGGDAKVGIPAFDQMGLLPLHMGGGENLIQVHLAHEVAGNGRGGGSGKHVDNGGELFAGGRKLAERDEFMRFLIGPLTRINVGHLGGIHHFRQIHLRPPPHDRTRIGNDFLKHAAPRTHRHMIG